MCRGLCFQQKQTLHHIQYPVQSSSQYMLKLTNDASPWKIPTNEKIKYDSYIRVLRRRRGLCC
jgi:hypothetical protein